VRTSHNVTFSDRVERLERVFGESPGNRVNILMWVGSEGGLFGHCKLLIQKNTGRIERKPCTEEEELRFMRQQYERDGKQLYGRGGFVTFSDYLQNYCYLGSAEFSEVRNEVIAGLRSGEESKSV
jgi:hypothetical protein